MSSTATTRTRRPAQRALAGFNGVLINLVLQELQSSPAKRHRKNGRIFRYYRCTHKNKNQRCDERTFIRHDKFAEEAKRNVQLIVIPDESKEKFLAKIETWESEVSQEKQQKIDAFKSDLTSLKAKIDRINNGFTEGSIDIAEFKELKNPLVVQKTDLEQQIVALEGSKLKRLEPPFTRSNLNRFLQKTL